MFFYKYNECVRILITFRLKSLKKKKKGKQIYVILVSMKLESS